MSRAGGREEEGGIHTHPNRSNRLLRSEGLTEHTVAPPRLTRTNNLLTFPPPPPPPLAPVWLAGWLLARLPPSLQLACVERRQGVEGCGTGMPTGRDGWMLDVGAGWMDRWMVYRTATAPGALSVCRLVGACAAGGGFWFWVGYHTGVAEGREGLSLVTFYAD